MKNYVGGLRAIQAKPMTRKEYGELHGSTVLKHENPDDLGYMVVNPNVSERNVDGFDGYVSWLPEKAFNEQYRAENLSFGQAVELLKQGKRVARSGWNGKGMFLLLIKGESVTEQINDCYGDPNRYEIGSSGYEKGQSIPVLDAIYMKTADDKLVAWLASQTDVLSEDWIVIE